MPTAPRGNGPVGGGDAAAVGHAPSQKIARLALLTRWCRRRDSGDAVIAARATATNCSARRRRVDRPGPDFSRCMYPRHGESVTIPPLPLRPGLVLGRNTDPTRPARHIGLKAAVAAGVFTYRSG